MPGVDHAGTWTAVLSIAEGFRATMSERGKSLEVLDATRLKPGAIAEVTRVEKGAIERRLPLARYRLSEVSGVE